MRMRVTYKYYVLVLLHRRTGYRVWIGTLWYYFFDRQWILLIHIGTLILNILIDFDQAPPLTDNYYYNSCDFNNSIIQPPPT